MTDEIQNIQSPCIRNCCLDEKDICLGCFRSLSEIIAWGQANSDGRTDILLNANERLKQINNNDS